MVPEELIHFVWQYRLFNQFELCNTDGEKITVLQVGQPNKDAGPDFLFCEILIEGQHWYGHVEIHVDGRDWRRHEHDKDEHYNNVILHVVVHHPVLTFRQDGTPIPVLVIGHLLDSSVVDRYEDIKQSLHWIPCATHLPQVTSLVKMQVVQRMTIQRLEHRTMEINEFLMREGWDWERLLFVRLCRSFGMKVNASAFETLARCIDLSLVRKYNHDVFKLEALLFGQAGFLTTEPKCDYIKKLRNEYSYLRKVHRLESVSAIEWKFMRMRPFNFPTFRLAQLLALYRRKPYLFQTLLECRSLEELKQLLEDVETSAFWQTHFTLYKESTTHQTNLSTAFIVHLIINCFVPVLFSYGKIMGEEPLQKRAFAWLEQLPGEHNNVVRSFAELNMIATCATDSQGMLQLKKDCCDQKKCLQCAIGVSLFF